MSQPAPNYAKLFYQQMLNLLTNPRQRGIFQWILEKGEAFKGQPLTAEQEKALVKILGKRGLYKPQHCFYNSQIVATDGGYRYFEGQATNERMGELPFQHGWLVKDGKVVDPTWRDGTDYFGVEIPVNFVRKNMLLTGEAQDLLLKYYVHLLEEKQIVT